MQEFIIFVHTCINILILLLFYLGCQVLFPCLTHVSTSPPPPPGAPYLVLTLVCPAPFPTPDSGFPAAHVTAGIGWSDGRSARSDFPYKQLTGTYSSVVPVDCCMSSSGCSAVFYLRYWFDVIPVVILESPDNCGLADHHSTLIVLLLTCSQRSGRQGTYLISRQSGGHGLGAHQTSHDCA